MDFKNYTWDLFPAFYKQFDSYKDQDGEGFLERFVKIFGEEVDEEVMKHLDEESDDYYHKNLDPQFTNADKLLHVIAELLGAPPNLLSDVEYRLLLKYIVKIYKFKGTFEAYKMFFNLWGFDVELDEKDPDQIVFTNLYDSGLYYDDLNRYDEDKPTCNTSYCSEYILTITPRDPNFTLTPELEYKLLEVAQFIEPINASVLVELPDIEVSDTDIGTYCIQEHLSIVVTTPQDETAYIFKAWWDCDGIEHKYSIFDETFDDPFN